MAAPETEKKEQASKPDSAPATAAAAPPATAPKKRRGVGLLGKLFLTVVLLLGLVGAAGYGALIFRNADPRVGEAAKYVDDGLAEAQDALEKAQAALAGLTGETLKPAPAKAPTRRALLDKAPLPATPEPEPAPPSQPAPAAEAAPAPAPAPVETAKEAEPAPAPTPTPEAPHADVPEPPRPPADLGRQPAVTAEATPTPTPAAPAVKTESADADGFTDRDLISALEGRIDTLSDQVQALREKLDAAKSESRVAPEVEAPKPGPAPVAAAPATSDGSAAAVVAAFALQRDLDAGRPYAEEIAALSRLQTEPAPAAILVEFAEKGAPTGADLRENFLPIAKRLRTHAAHPEGGAESGGALTDHLLEGASKLVKVRPTGQAHPESLDGKLDRIEIALGRNDFAAAESLFDSLPEEARTEARDFGERLHQRNEAAKAADELLRGALAALGRK